MSMNKDAQKGLDNALKRLKEQHTDHVIFRLKKMIREFKNHVM